MQEVSISVNQGASRSDQVLLYDNRTGTKVAIPEGDVSAIKLEVRLSPDRNTAIVDTITPTRDGDYYTITLSDTITNQYVGNLWADLKVTLSDGFSDYFFRLKYTISDTTTV